MGDALVSNNFKENLANNIENFISHCEFVWNENFNGMKRKVTRCCHSIKTLLTLKVSQYRKIGSMISSSKPVAASSVPTAQKRPVFVLARPTRASRAGALPQELGRWFCLQWDCQTTGWGSNLDSNLNYHLRNHSINCVEFEFFLSPLLMPNLSQAK